MSTVMHPSTSLHDKRLWWVYGLRILFSLVIFASAALKLSSSEAMVGTLSHLGYPLYLLSILGIAYLLGLAALWQPWVPFLAEWAHGGFTAALCAAFASHLFAGDPVNIAIVPLVLLMFLWSAYGLERRISK